MAFLLGVRNIKCTGSLTRVTFRLWIAGTISISKYTRASAQPCVWWYCENSTLRCPNIWMFRYSHISIFPYFGVFRGIVDTKADRISSFKKLSRVIVVFLFLWLLVSLGCSYFYSCLCLYFYFCFYFYVSISISMLVFFHPPLVRSMLSSICQTVRTRWPSPPH